MGATYDPAMYRVLYVDDDPDVLDLMRECLEAEGYEVSAVANAHAALKALRSRHFDLVVTDQMLPDETGGSMLLEASARGLLQDTPAMIVTANSEPEQIKRPAGVLTFQKPLEFDGFLATVHDLLLLRDTSGNHPARDARRSVH
jgi:CheY-like chemotaxis protein